ncbi:DUF922 domain-containing protein [Nocardioides sp. WS12]|uniref:DUF922 domain-containing protein n=1 Tax=Nocardioides sp. WS12 TaxID=2486272 RepID=UPI0015F92D8B|nr:DUF922 domain-containing protein [Nocardioides sp. WS12]
MALAEHHHGAEHERPDAYARETTPGRTPQGVLALQRAAGNGAVAGLLGVQRYAVGAAADSDATAVLAWLAANSPYAPEAAHTQAAFSMTRTFDAKEAKDKSWTVKVTASTVTVAKSVDMPTWAPTKIKKEWTAAHTALRAHEARHEGVADTWKATLKARLAAYTFTSTTATSWDDATAEAGVDLDEKWATWIEEHQKAQEKLDPYAVVIAGAAAPVAPVAPVTPDADAAPESGETPSPIEE